MSDPTPLQLLTNSMVEMRETMNRQFGELNDKVDRVEGHVTQTNGRVGKLELWQARFQGAQAAMKWLPQLMIAAAASGIGAVIVLVAHP